MHKNSCFCVFLCKRNKSLFGCSCSSFTSCCFDETAVYNNWTAHLKHIIKSRNSWTSLSWKKYHKNNLIGWLILHALNALFYFLRSGFLIVYLPMYEHCGWTTVKMIESSKHLAAFTLYPFKLNNHTKHSIEWFDQFCNVQWYWALCARELSHCLYKVFINTFWKQEVFLQQFNMIDFFYTPFSSKDIRKGWGVSSLSCRTNH